jgi:4-amino-4-deoxychorismate lyase
MSLLFETILISKGAPQNIIFHEKRMNAARRYFWKSDPVELLSYIPSVLPREEGLRCRVEYGQNVNKVDLLPLHTRPVKTLRLVHSDAIEYSFKYCDRSMLQELFSKKDKADDILIIKNGLVTDTSAGNIVFTDGIDYFTPAGPLLKGTQRSFLLESGIIGEAVITEEEIARFVGWQHINALNPFHPDRFNLPENLYR